MSEVGICKSLAGGGSLLAPKEGGGWHHPVEREEHPVGDANTVSEGHDKESAYQNPGQLVKAEAQEDDWKELGKKRHRRLRSKNKRRWKPYDKLTWEEKKELEERQSQRASRIRAEMIAKGQPVAPYNTTQFLMEDHDQEEPDLCPPPRKSSAALPLALNNSSYKGDSTDDDLEEEEDEAGSDGMGGYDGEDFLQKDFSETYERYHAESLQDMSKQDLIKEYLELEKCLSRMEEENNHLRVQSLASAPAADHRDTRIQELQVELEKLKEENQRLLQEGKQVAADSP
ncbi:protein HEXIM1 [Xenopus laevis]|uniref:Protein HEXIM1 n=2 Tax=Xenopus laevis TaxID=8355 RepID=HEXI1_XENLA|nr:protein HEXIM1 [Xenopus laevis]Q4V7W3.1 RecName: Full=Protein HEXIM1 [Xenopus laevis]AAH97693.1 Hexim1 protein [Xenopus laevis]OCT62240.1 hypothetical protein XELAEV_18043324mg [Xenopus laevis]